MSQENEQWIEGLRFSETNTFSIIRKGCAKYDFNIYTRTITGIINKKEKSQSLHLTG